MVRPIGEKAPAMAMYMNWDGLNGDVTESKHQGWIELSSLQWRVGRSISTAMSGMASRESGIPSVSEVTVTKAMDSSSPGLWTDAVAGALDTTVKIAFTTTSKGDTTEFLVYELTNTGLSGYTVSSGGDMPNEALSLNFTKVVWTFTGTDPSVAGSPTTQGYDLTLAKIV
jgi:type VI secretion system secreted protein Hcp